MLFLRFLIQSHSYIEIDTSVQNLPSLHISDFAIIKPTSSEKVRIGYLVRETLKGMRQGAKLKSLIDVNNFRRSQVHPVL